MNKNYKLLYLTAALLLSLTSREFYPMSYTEKIVQRIHQSDILTTCYFATTGVVAITPLMITSASSRNLAAYYFTAALWGTSVGLIYSAIDNITESTHAVYFVDFQPEIYNGAALVMQSNRSVHPERLLDVPLDNIAYLYGHYRNRIVAKFSYNQRPSGKSALTITPISYSWMGNPVKDKQNSIEITQHNQQFSIISPSKQKKQRILGALQMAGGLSLLTASTIFLFKYRK